MIKLVFCIRRRADMTGADFHSYWLHQHGPKVKAIAATIGALRYVQSHTCEPEINDMLRLSRGLEDPYDGITEVWWESAEAMTRAFSTPEGKVAMKLLIEDEAQFIDLKRSRVFMTTEHEIFDFREA